MMGISGQQKDYFKSNERRTGGERRNWRCGYDYPYIDSHGELVLEDRRQATDRRDCNASSSIKNSN